MKKFKGVTSLHTPQSEELIDAQRAIDYAMYERQFKDVIKKNIKLMMSIGFEKWERLEKAQTQFDVSCTELREKRKAKRKAKRKSMDVITIDLDNDSETDGYVSDDDLLMKAKDLPAPSPPAPPYKPVEETRADARERRLTKKQLEKQKKMAMFLIGNSAFKREFSVDILDKMNLKYQEGDYNEVFELALEVDSKHRPVVKKDPQKYEPPSREETIRLQKKCEAHSFETLPILIDEAFAEYNAENNNADGVQVQIKAKEILKHLSGDLHYDNIAKAKEAVKCILVERD